MNLQLFFERLKTARLDRGLTQDAMASAVGVSKRSYCAYEAGETAPSAKLLAALALMNIYVAYLLTGIECAAQALLDAKQARITRAVDAGMSIEEVRAMERVSDPASVDAIMALLHDCRATERAAVFTLLSSIVGLRKAPLAAQPNAARGGRK